MRGKALPSATALAPRQAEKSLEKRVEGDKI
jgi:hypothetical protein